MNIIDQLEADSERLAWLDENPARLEDVRGWINNNGGTVRQAIDALEALAARYRAHADGG